LKNLSSRVVPFIKPSDLLLQQFKNKKFTLFQIMLCQLTNQHNIINNHNFVCVCPSILNSHLQLSTCSTLLYQHTPLQVSVWFLFASISQEERYFDSNSERGTESRRRQKKCVRRLRGSERFNISKTTEGKRGAGAPLPPLKKCWWLWFSVKIKKILYRVEK